MPQVKVFMLLNKQKYYSGRNKLLCILLCYVENLLSLQLFNDCLSDNKRIFVTDVRHSKNIPLKIKINMKPEKSKTEILEHHFKIAYSNEVQGSGVAKCTPFMN